MVTNVGWHDVFDDGHEVAVHQVKPIGDVAPSSLLTSGRNVGRRRLHGSHPLSTGGQELEAERADTGAHIQHCPPLPCPENRVPQ